METTTWPRSNGYHSVTSRGYGVQLEVTLQVGQDHQTVMAWGRGDDGIERSLGWAGADRRTDDYHPARSVAPAALIQGF